MQVLDILNVSLVRQGTTLQSECKICNLGAYSNNTASILCMACKAGKYSKSGWSTCESCGAGSYSLQGESKCKICRAGLIVIVLYPVNVRIVLQANIQVQALLSVSCVMRVITVLKAVVHICSVQQVR